MGRTILLPDEFLDREIDIVSCEICGKMWLSSNPRRSLATHRWGKHRLKTEICPGCGRPLVQRHKHFDCMNPDCPIVAVAKGRVMKAAVI